MNFWDEPIQKIRVGNDLTKCYFTRFIPPQSKVTGDKVLVAIELEATDQVARLTINGEAIEVTRTSTLGSKVLLVKFQNNRYLPEVRKKKSLLVTSFLDKSIVLCFNHNFMISCCNITLFHQAKIR